MSPPSSVMLQCAENSNTLITRHPDSLFSDFGLVMSKQPDEYNYHNIEEHRADNKPTEQPSEPFLSQILQRYEEDFESFYHETYLPNNPNYPEKLEVMNPLEVAPNLPGPSGISSPAPLPVSGNNLESFSNASTTSSDPSYYSDYSKQPLGASSYRAQPYSSVEVFEGVFNEGLSFNPPTTLNKTILHSQLEESNVPSAQKKNVSTSSSLAPVVEQPKASYIGGPYRSFNKPKKGR